MLSLALLTGGRNHILPLLEQDPTWQRTRLKSPEGAASVLVQISKKVVLEEATALILPDIQYWYIDYVKINGQRPENYDEGKKDDWDEGHDDGLLALFESFTNVLSASWLAFTTTDAQIWKEGEDEKLAKSFANEVWKQLTWQRTNNQILAGVGILTSDLEVYGAMTPEPEEPPQPEFNAMAVAGVLNRIMLSFPDPKELADNLDLVSDDDDGLAAGAAQRLGISLDDAKVLRVARMKTANAMAWWQSAIETGESLDESVPDTSDIPEATAEFFEKAKLIQPTRSGNGGPPPPPTRSLDVPPPPPPRAVHTNIQGVAVPPPPPPPPPPTVTVGSGPPTNTGRGGKRIKNAETPPPGTILPDVLRQIKEHTGLKDEILAEMLGLSRPTLANIMKGRGWCVPEASRRTAIQTMLSTHIRELSDALNKIA